MTVDQATRPDPVLVGIDIAKNRHEVLIQVPNRKRRRKVTIDLLPGLSSFIS